MSPPPQPTFVFDLDGTLVDTVYQHVTAWQRAFRDLGVELPGWLAHRRIGMGGELLARRVGGETGRELTPSELEKAVALHGDYYFESMAWIRALPGARDLLMTLTDSGVPWAIASSGKQEEAAALLAKLDLDVDPVVVTSDDVSAAKPDPQLFLTAAERIGSTADECIVVGDAVWDMLSARRAKMLAIGLLCGGCATEELQRAQAMRVYADPAELLSCLDEVGVLIG